MFGFSRVAAVDDLVIVGGTTSVDPSGVVLGTTPYEQLIEILRKVEHELSRVGLGLDRVVHTRVYVTDITRAAEVGRAHGDVFGDIRPLMTMIGVSGLVDPRMLVEVETFAAR
jgi:enamine deaminase RidA (YjgF/YER057c/UK114 family)